MKRECSKYVNFSIIKKWSEGEMRWDDVGRMCREKSLDNNEELVSHLVIAEIEGRAATTSKHIEFF